MKAPTKSELVKKNERLAEKILKQSEIIDSKDRTIERERREREDLRLRYVEARRIYEQMDIEDAIKIGDEGEKYQTVDPANSDWMASSDAYIKICTTGYDADYARLPKQRVCTIPIPDLTGGMRWNTKLPETYRYKGSGDGYAYKVSPHWKLIKEDEEGQHWYHPHVETKEHVLIEQEYLIETRDQIDRRQKKELRQRMNEVITLAGQIQDLYNKCGEFPDAEIEVSAAFAVRTEV